MFVRQNNASFKEWLKSPIETVDGMVYDEYEIEIVSDYKWKPHIKPITHQNFVNSVYNDIMKILEKNGYIIHYRKSFKDELTRIIYSLSDNSSYGPT